MNITPSKWIYLLITTLAIFLIYFIVTSSPISMLSSKISSSGLTQLMSGEVAEKDEIIKELSRLLNQASNKIGKLSCQLNGDDVSANGGWCSKISGKNSSQHMTDVPLAKALSLFLKGKTVASFGDGPGKRLIIHQQ